MLSYGDHAVIKAKLLGIEAQQSHPELSWCLLVLPIPAPLIGLRTEEARDGSEKLIYTLSWFNGKRFQSLDSSHSPETWGHCKTRRYNCLLPPQACHNCKAATQDTEDWESRDSRDSDWKTTKLAKDLMNIMPQATSWRTGMTGGFLCCRKYITISV